MSRLAKLAFLLCAAVIPLSAQRADFTGIIPAGNNRAALAVPDFRGDTQTQRLMDAFNQTLWNDLDSAAFFRMVPKGLYPTMIPQQPSDFRSPDPQASQSPGGGGLWAQDWSRPPARAEYLAGGYAVEQKGFFRLRGWLVDLSRPAVATMFDQPYAESLDAAGARTAAHKFAADILAKFAIAPLFGSHIYFVRESRPAPDRRTDIWMMDYDGGNQRQITRCDAICTQPAISPDGSKLALVRVGLNAGVLLYSVESGKQLRFDNRKNLSAASSPSFTPDGRQILYSQSDGHGLNIWIADADGSHQRRITDPQADDVEPKVNPKTGAEIAFTSGRSGHAQLYRMNMDGLDVDRLSDGLGEAANPSWHPSGQFLAFASTHGIGAAGWNIFWMDMGRREVRPLTHDEGRNENPVWAPDGRHLAFMSDRSGRPQIWITAADGTGVRQLTFEGRNSTPAWGR